MKFLDWIKEHPWEMGGGVFAAGALLLLITKGGGSPAVASGADPNVLSYDLQQAQLGLQQQQLQTAASAQNAQLSAQLQATTAGYQVQEDQLKAELAGLVDTNSTNQTINQQNVGGAVSINQSNNDATVASTGLITGAQVATAQSANNAAIQIAHENALLQSNEAMYNSQALIGEANALEGGVKAQASASQTGSIFGAIGSIVGSLF